jgi:putative peptidoglycan lipid II flippase
LALGHATAYTFATAVAVVILSRRLGGLPWRSLGGALGRILVAGAATGAAAWAVSRVVERSLGTAALSAQLVQVFGGVAAGLAVFVAVARAFRLEEVEMIRRLVIDRLRRPV